jgi:drug/metabolite transporter (DMT)-like permease
MTSYLVIGFISATIVAGALSLYRRFKYKEDIKQMMHKNVIWLILTAGITTAFGNYLIVFLVSRIPAVVLFPVTNGGQVIFMTIASVLIFKEKLTLRSIIGIFIGAIAIALISL